MARVERANEAKTILQSRLWSEAWAAIDGGLIDKWRATRITADREELWRYIQTTSKLRAHFENVINDGEMAQKQLEALQQQSQLTEMLRYGAQKVRGSWG